MFDFVADGVTPGDDTTIWSRLPIQGRSAGALTPFSASVIDEMAGRAVVEYYAQLGFGAIVRRDVVRRLHGHIYLNLSLISRIEAEHAGVEPMTLRINGEIHRLAQVERRRLFGGLKTGRNQKKIDEWLGESGAGVEGASRQASYWLQRTRDVPWTQADILQVMEEIERTGASSMMAFLASRYNLDRLYNKLIVSLLESVGYPASLGLINAALQDVDSLVEMGMAAALVELGDELPVSDEAMAWLGQEAFPEWQQSAPDRELAEGLATFLNVYGHRAVDEAEMARPRWYEEPAPVMHGLLGVVRRQAALPAPTPSSNSIQRLLSGLDNASAKAAPAMIRKMRTLLHIQSHELHALAYVWAGTREWAKAAAHETVSDGRLLNEEDIFYFELEEIKQMMTGEWNVSDLDGIRSTVARRRAEYLEWSVNPAPPLLIDEAPAWSVQTGLPAAAGKATAPLRRLADKRTEHCRNAILGAEHLDSGWALALPTAMGFVAAGGAPTDPFVVAARAWHRPSVVGLGAQFASLVEGAQTDIDGDSGHVAQ